jgi:hypothetical protein
MLKKKFEVRGNDVTKEWGNLHNDRPHDLYSSSKFIWLVKSRIMRWVGAWGTYWGEERCTWDFMGKPGGKKQL